MKQCRKIIKKLSIIAILPIFFIKCERRPRPDPFQRSKRCYQDRRKTLILWVMSIKEGAGYGEMLWKPGERCQEMARRAGARSALTGNFLPFDNKMEDLARFFRPEIKYVHTIGKGAAQQNMLIYFSIFGNRRFCIDNLAKHIGDL